MLFALQVDRGNLAQGVSDDMLQDLSLSTNGLPPVLHLSYDPISRLTYISWY
jgi:hypothetical protein